MNNRNKLGMKNAIIGPRGNPRVRRGQSIQQKVGDAPSMLPNTNDVMARKKKLKEIDEADIRKELADSKGMAYDLKKHAADVLLSGSILTEVDVPVVTGDSMVESPSKVELPLKSQKNDKKES